MKRNDIHAGDRVFLELFDGNAHPMWIFDIETLRFLAVNSAATKKYGYSREEFLAMTVLDIRSPEEAERLKSHLRRQTGKVDQAGRWLHRTHRGEVLHMDITAQKITFGSRRAMLALAVDVSDHIRVMENLKVAENMYRGLVEHSMVGIFIVKNLKLAYANPRLAEMFGYTPEELQTMDLPDLAAPFERDAVLASIKALLSDPQATGRREFTGLRRDGTEIIVDIHNTRIGGDGAPIMMGVALDITEARRAEARSREHVAHLERMLGNTLSAISAISAIRDAYTAMHESRVGNLALAIGAELGMDSRQQQALRTAGVVHDAGKIGIPAEILSKPTRLTKPEYELIKTHAQLGYDVLRHIDFPQPIAEAVLQHHERLDGSGYPQGLDAGIILPMAKILAVADTVESMTSHRPYRPQLGIGAALEEIEKNSGRHYDADVGTACVRLFRERNYQIH